MSYGDSVCPKCKAPVTTQNGQASGDGRLVHRQCEARVPMMLGLDHTGKIRRLSRLTDEWESCVFVSDCEQEKLRVEIRLHSLADTNRMLKEMGF